MWIRDTQRMGKEEIFLCKLGIKSFFCKLSLFSFLFLFEKTYIKNISQHSGPRFMFLHNHSSSILYLNLFSILSNFYFFYEDTNIFAVQY